MFGCDAYSHIPKDEHGKFNTKARRCSDVQFNVSAKNCRHDLHNVDKDNDDYKLIIDFSSDAKTNTVQDVQPVQSIQPRHQPDK